MKEIRSCDCSSWGGLPVVRNQKCLQLRDFTIPQMEYSILPRGLGRSYGDSCLNEDGVLLLTKDCHHFIDFNAENGELICESGVTLDEILKVFVPKGWFLPVTPGTKFVTVGGAVANDVHGKNHHKFGNFGHHITFLEILRSDGTLKKCSSRENPELFCATIGGLGLTGLITKVGFKLIPIKSSMIDQEQIKFNTLLEFFELSKESEEKFDYTVAWVDCVNGRDLKGIYIRGNHALEGPLTVHEDPKLKVPFHFPDWALNKLTISLFNYLYYFKNFQKVIKSKVHYDSFFYPLDKIHDWNKIYGKRGFYQYQFVVPFDDQGINALEEILALIKKSGMGSFLVVMKTFGPIASLGKISFPQEGITLALDFPNLEVPLLSLLNDCDRILKSVHGRIYPAKDARMSSDFFKSSYNIDEFMKYLDPKFQSSFFKRMLK